MNRFSLPSARRFLVVDAGSRCLKVLLVSMPFGRIHVHAHRVVGLDEAAQPNTPGWTRLLHELAAELGVHPLALTVPQHATDSQVLDLPGSDDASIREQIQADVVRLSGLTESAIVYDHGRLAPFAHYAEPYWITHAREDEVLAVVAQFSELGGDIWEISSPANALVAAYRETGAPADNVLLVDIGSAGTVVAVIHRGQGVYVTSYAVGGLMFGERIRTERGCSLSEAEFAKNTENLLAGSAASSGLRQLVDRWHGELVHIVEDWLREHPAANVSAGQFEVVLSGGEAEMPGLLDYLRTNSVLSFRRWADLPEVPALQPVGQFAVAYGLACQLLKRAAPSASLVPEEMRSIRKEQQAVYLMQAGVWFLLAITALVLGFGTWLKHRQIADVEEQILQAGSIIERARRADDLKLRLATEAEELRPALERQRQTFSAVRTLALLAQKPPPTNAWFVLFADADSYYAEPALPPPTNAPPAAAPAAAGVRLTNAFVAEFSTSLDAVSARAMLSAMIDGFKEARFFSKVDILSEDQRRRLVPDSVLVPQGHYALSFTPDENEFTASPLSPEEMRRLVQPAGAERAAGPGPARRSGTP
jgi:Tfp pilus assembly PilM family ATPase